MKPGLRVKIKGLLRASVGSAFVVEGGGGCVCECDVYTCELCCACLFLVCECVLVYVGLFSVCVRFVCECVSSIHSHKSTQS